jgi:hypothetical protein
MQALDTASLAQEAMGPMGDLVSPMLEFAKIQGEVNFLFIDTYRKNLNIHKLSAAAQEAIPARSFFVFFPERNSQ